MVLLTEKQIFYEPFLVEKLEAIKERVTGRKLDCIIMIDGDEGFGKSGMSQLIAYYLAEITGREFSLDDIFFDPKELMDYINNNKKKIIIWDEAALGGLASGWQSKVQQMIIQTLMTCRSRQHIIIFNVPKFYRLNRYFVSDRADALIHVYSEDKINAGRFSYYKKETLEKMMDFYARKKTKPYKKYYKKFLRGKFPDAFNFPIINEKEYDKKKDKNTSKMLEQYGGTVKVTNLKELKIQYAISMLKGLSDRNISQQIGISRNTLMDWRKIPEKFPEVVNADGKISLINKRAPRFKAD